MVERYRGRNVRTMFGKPLGVNIRHAAGHMAYGRSHAVQGRHGHSQQGSGIHWAYQIRKLTSHGGPYAADRSKARERRRVMALGRSSDACRGKQTAHVELRNYTEPPRGKREGVPCFRSVKDRPPVSFTPRRACSYLVTAYRRIRLFMRKRT